MPAATHNEPREVEIDPWDDATSVEPQKFFGQVFIVCTYDIGIETSPDNWEFSAYSQAMHGSQSEIRKDKSKFLSSQVEITVVPIDLTHKTITRKMSAKYYKRPAFPKVVWPSIMALEEKVAQVKGLVSKQFKLLREFDGLWVSGEFVPEPGNDGWTTLKFLDVYPTQAACAEAAGIDDPGAPIPGFESAPAAQAPPMQDKIRAQMALFIPAMWAQSGQDYAKFLEIVESNPLLNKHFDVDSPELEKYKIPF